MKIIGIDLSGPSNHKDTAAVVCREEQNQLYIEDLQTGLSDQAIISIISKQAKENNKIYVGIDAPLSYQDGGGDREADRELRSYAKHLGVKSGSIMPPTLTRMIYLTARGIHLAHMIKNSLSDKVEIVEVHPGIALASRLPIEDRSQAVLYKKDEQSRKFVHKWLSEVYFQLVDHVEESSTHQLDACLAALACWHWSSEIKSPAWHMPEQLPHHPFPFSC
ncbi:hypothetical protein CEH05_18800 [Halobacillus halophilus]|uniref:DUF429 domain-containing protein n=1 Tax=Halobacillus halophilus (strain ATCC 35676 / DSM 2266 / JCM 20832 / KCTC 3685 / LMG 17431 / NBRC 102448 / NCIMB 2269) TaxID=866895 RepID=I0JSP8_HALH3|nr:DUF429 domain-containing protein [Halobacillus halophilus]ASF41099.1 hypothetical protein CEH05_18800 [Halobacillus halophilus]CCG47170.1 hypothetical protein HBHAL_4832 [Halobacillus halophilus DSM 2266]